MDESLETVVPAEGHVGQEGDFDVVERAGAGAGFAFIVGGGGPSVLGIVDFHLGPADHGEVLLGDVAGREAEEGAGFRGLLEGGDETQAGEVGSAVDADGEVVAQFADLRTGCRRKQAEEDEGARQAKHGAVMGETVHWSAVFMTSMSGE